MTIRRATCGCLYWDDGEERLIDNTQIKWCNKCLQISNEEIQPWRPSPTVLDANIQTLSVKNVL